MTGGRRSAMAAWLPKKFKCTTLWCMKTEVYSWRLSGELKSTLEREARQRKVPVAAVLESAVRDLLKKEKTTVPEEEEQRRLHSAAARCLGIFASGTARRSETAREAVRARLRRRYGR